MTNVTNIVSTNVSKTRDDDRSDAAAERRDNERRDAATERRDPAGCCRLVEAACVPPRMLMVIYIYILYNNH